MTFTLTSPAFRNDAPIPDQCARDKENLSPQFDWSDPPEGTRSFVLVMEDPDASSASAFRHWAVYDIPRDRRHLAPGRSSGANTESLPHAFNDFGNLRYDGPLETAAKPWPWPCCCDSILLIRAGSGRWCARRWVR
jgi:Raf kinase inhibitor-like YbhB/YbcL family protein